MGTPVYDPDTHETWCDGEQWPHVTGILSAVGVSAQYEDVGPARQRALEAASARGTAVHADCHAYDDDDLDLAQVDPRTRPYVEAWAECREALGLRPLSHGRERYVWHPTYRYAGILDGIWVRDGRLVLGDLKTGDPENAAAHLQTAAYELAHVALFPASVVSERWAIWLRPGRSVPYSIINYTRLERWPGEHAATWLACLEVYREQHGRRARVSVVA